MVLADDATEIAWAVSFGAVVIVLIVCLSWVAIKNKWR